jgi:hypothetical protein
MHQHDGPVLTGSVLRDRVEERPSHIQQGGGIAVRRLLVRPARIGSPRVGSRVVSGGVSNRSFTAVIAAISSAASSPGSRARNSTDAVVHAVPGHHPFRLLADPLSGGAADPAIIRASRDAVAVSASSHSRASSTTSTTRVTFRTFEYESRPSRTPPTRSASRPRPAGHPDLLPRRPR